MPLDRRAVFWRNLMAAFSAQGVALISSLVMSLVVPKILGLEAFSYWQLFIFYCTYAGCFHFGLNDGVYLRVGGQHFSALDFPCLAGQMRYAVLVQSVIGAGICVVAWVSNVDANRMFVILMFTVYMVTVNIFTFVGMILQATNRVAEFSIGVIIDKVLFLAVIAASLMGDYADFRVLIIGHIACRLVSIAYFWVRAKQIFHAHGSGPRRTLAEMFINVRVGVNLMLANVAGALVLGAGRQVIDMRWGITTFGKVSLALSVMTFVVQFVGQVSLVMYPALRLTTAERQVGLAATLRSALDIVLPLVFVMYVPLSIVLTWWLPEYAESFFILGLLMPLAVFEARMQLVVLTYYKVLRWERTLLALNTGSMALAIASSIVAAYVLDSVIAVVIAMVLSVVIRSLIGEYVLAKRIGQAWISRSFVSMFLVAAVFGLTNFIQSVGVAWAITVIACILHLTVNLKGTKQLLALRRRQVR